MKPINRNPAARSIGQNHNALGELALLNRIGVGGLGDSKMSSFAVNGKFVATKCRFTRHVPGWRMTNVLKRA